MPSSDFARDVEAVSLDGDAEARRLRAAWPLGIDLHSRTHSAVYKAYPHLFRQAFPGVGDDAIGRLAFGLRLVSDALITLDKVLDGATPRLASPVLSAEALQFEANQILFSLFPPGAPFWTRFRTYFGEFASAAIAEDRLIAGDGHWALIPEGMLREIAGHKASVAKSVVAGLVELSSESDLLEPLTASMHHCHLALQYLDDVQDWKADLKRGLPTVVLRRFIKRRPALETLTGDRATDDYARELFAGGHADAVFNDALVEFARARELAAPCDVPAWLERVERSRVRCEKAIEDIRAPADRPMVSSKPPAAESPAPKSLPKASFDPDPRHFTGAFPQITPAVARRFAEGLSHLYDVLPSNRWRSGATSYSLESAFRRAREVFAELVPPQSPFWGRLSGVWQTVVSAQAGSSSGDLRSMIQNGATVAELIPWGLAELGQDATHTTALRESIAFYVIGIRHMADVQHWKADLAAKTPTFATERLIQAGMGSESATGDARPLTRAFYLKGHASSLLNAGLEALEQARASVAELPVAKWQQSIEASHQQLSAAFEDVESVRRKQQAPMVQPKRVPTLALPPATTPWQALAWKALAFLNAQADDGFREARHLGLMRRVAGVARRQAVQACDVFQRAVIADVLCDADGHIGGRLRSVIDSEVEYLLSRRSLDPVGGWRYFPTEPLLPPDTDDLAQVMQVFLRSGRRDLVDQYASVPLRVLLADCTRPDGGFETWIIPRTSPLYVTRSEGGTAPEVVANMAYALSLYGETAYYPAMQMAADYLESVQEKDGRWTGVWYFGPFYSTYVCLRALAAIRPYSPALDRALAFLESARRREGSWGGEESGGTSLETAFGLLGLTVGYSAGRAKALVAGADLSRGFLEGNHHPGLPWDKTPWIVMGISPYGSHTITAAYVLKAALAWHSIVSNVPSVDPHIRLESV